MTGARRFRIITGLWASALLGAPNAPGDELWRAKAEKTFEVVWSTVNEAYFDPTFGGVNWKEVGTRYRAQLGKTTTNEELRPLLQAMLRELDRSHFFILPREMAVFAPEERSRIGTV